MSTTTLKSDQKKKSIFSLKIIFLYTLLIILAFMTFLPFYIMIINSTHSSQAIAQGINILPGSEFFNNLKRTSGQVNLVKGFGNSLFVSIIATTLAAYFGSLTAFAFSKYHFKGNKILFWVVIGSMMFPPQLGILGYNQICTKLHLINSLWALILPTVANAMLVFFIKLYIDGTVTDSLLEAARIDGCSEFRIFNQIVLPIITPSIAAMSIFTFFTSWNNYLQANIVLKKESLYTIPLIAANALGVYRNDYGAVYVIVALSMIPIMIVFAFGSKYIIGGLTSGAVKE